MNKQEIEAFNKLRKELAKELKQRFINPTQKDWNGSDVNEAFKDNIFSGDNWNDGRIGLFRALFSDWSSDAFHNNWLRIADTEIIKVWHDDNNYVTLRDTNTNDLYYVEWYKSRGATSEFLKNGRPITLIEYEALITTLLLGDIAEDIY